MAVIGTSWVILARNRPRQNVQNVLIRYGAQSSWLPGKNGSASHGDSGEVGLWGVGRWKGEHISRCQWEPQEEISKKEGNVGGMIQCYDSSEPKP